MLVSTIGTTLGILKSLLKLLDLVVGLGSLNVMGLHLAVSFISITGSIGSNLAGLALLVLYLGDVVLAVILLLLSTLLFALSMVGILGNIPKAVVEILDIALCCHNLVGGIIGGTLGLLVSVGSLLYLGVSLASGLLLGIKLALHVIFVPERLGAEKEAVGHDWIHLGKTLKLRE